MIPGFIQVSPPGISTLNNFKGEFLTNSSRIYYLKKNKRNKYKSIKAEECKNLTFAIDVGSGPTGLPIYIGRIQDKTTGFWRFGYYSTTYDTFSYVNDKNEIVAMQSGYELLMCKSYKHCKEPTPVPEPTFKTFPLANVGCSK